MAVGEVGRAGAARMSPAVYVLALGVFVVGTGEFVLAGLIPEFAAEFGVTTGHAGQVVTVFAATCAIAGPVATAMTAHWPRRRVLLTAGVIYLAGGAATAVAPSFEALLGAQAVAAVGTGMFVPNASVSAAALVPGDRSGRAIATVVTGFTAAVAFGAPAGTAVGAALGWRVTLWLATFLAVVGVVGVAMLVPRGLVVGDGAGGFREMVRPLAAPRVVALLATTLVAFTAIYVPYTYIGAVFEPATGGDGVRLSLLMAAFGVAGTVGNLVAGRTADRLGGSAVVIVALGWTIVVFVAIVPFLRAEYAWSLVAVALYGFAAFAITTPQQHRLISHDPGRASVLVSINQAVLYLAIAASGAVGAAGIDLVGARGLTFIAAALAVLGIVLSRLGSAGRGRRRRGSGGSLRGFRSRVTALGPGDHL